MEITRLEDVAQRPRQLALGEFDGVHLGHREVIRGADTAVTFDPHPRAVVAPGAAPRLLTPLARKAELIAALGVSELVVIAFDETFAAQTPQGFIDAVLVERLSASEVSVGENFRFGHRAGGEVELLRADGRFDVRVAPLVEVAGEAISSSQIRALIAAGEVDAAARFLGAPLQVCGTVVDGDRRGRELGFPTANLVPDERYVYPAHGVYAGIATLASGEQRASAINVGVRPTFETAGGMLVEAFLLDFAGDIYGQELRIDFLARLRGEQRFAAVEALVEQMEHDVEQARALVRASATLAGR